MTQQQTAPNLYEHLLHSAEAVSERIDEMAAELVERYRDDKPLFVCLLRGGAPFATQLMFAVAKLDPTFHPELDYMTVRTYATERSASHPELVMGLAPGTDIHGRTVVMLDDVLDKGHTAGFTSGYLRLLGAASVDLVVLMQKQCEREHYPEATIHGFVAPDEWLTGMGMDDTRLAREANRGRGSRAHATPEPRPLV
jgi:hypoxanthine phosphoribosyltransferase